MLTAIAVGLWAWFAWLIWRGLRPGIADFPFWRRAKIAGLTACWPALVFGALCLWIWRGVVGARVSVRP
jgi:hypothetical protein